jgi:CrcB protein
MAKGCFEGDDMTKPADFRAPIAIALGAIAGACCRYYVDQWVSQWIEQLFDSGFPIGTMIVNISGCFLMGVVAALITRQGVIPPERILFATTGFLGSYTTFSTYQLDTVQLIDTNHVASVAIYSVGSCLLGLLWLWLGKRLVRAIAPGRFEA